MQLGDKSRKICMQQQNINLHHQDWTWQLDKLLELSQTPDGEYQVDDIDLNIITVSS